MFSVCNTNYSILSESYRRESIPGSWKDNIYNCDQDKIDGSSWYRFNLSSGENGVIDSCPKWQTCGTTQPIWMNNTHPTEYGVIKTVTMGSSSRGIGFWHAHDSNCFYFNGSAQVTKCNINGDVFYLYKLWQPPCYLSYCTRKYDL